MKNSISILVVDDEEVMRQLLSKILTREGYQLHTLVDGTEALEYLKAHHVDILISDIRMPGIDGLELVQLVKKRYPKIKLILMTGYGETYSVTDALLHGADEYITKPFRSYEVSLVVERAYWRILAREPGEPTGAY